MEVDEAGPVGESTLGKRSKAQAQDEFQPRELPEKRAKLGNDIS